MNLIKFFFKSVLWFFSILVFLGLLISIAGSSFDDFLDTIGIYLFTLILAVFSNPYLFEKIIGYFNLSSSLFDTPFQFVFTLFLSYSILMLSFSPENNSVSSENKARERSTVNNDAARNEINKYSQMAPPKLLYRCSMNHPYVAIYANWGTLNRLIERARRDCGGSFMTYDSEG